MVTIYLLPNRSLKIVNFSESGLNPVPSFSKTLVKVKAHDVVELNVNL